MPASIADVDPHRRNLMMLSIAFIAYFLSGAQMDADGLRLGMIGVDITRPWVIGVIAWLMLFWFAWQYWLHSHESALETFRTKAVSTTARISPRFQRAASVIIGVPYLDQAKIGEACWTVRRIRVSTFLGAWALAYQKGTKSNAGGFSGGGEVNCSVSGGAVLPLKLWLVVKAMIIYPSFSVGIVPYILFVLAVGVGVWGTALELLKP